ncbi:MAG TPA: hypothetical protein DIV39_10930 [Verrucomicrobiales bacterium]|nr:hypothetical protein [Verrucomicrobiales bacterium]
MISLPSLHRNDALFLSRCSYLGLIVLLFPLKSASSIVRLSADHFHPPLGPFSFLESFPAPWVIVVIESLTCALLALWVVGIGQWRVGALLSFFLMITSGLVYSTGKIDHDFVILLCPFLLTLRGTWPEKTLMFCLAVYFASSGFAKITWLTLDTQASLSWALTYFHGYGKSAPLLAWSLGNLPGWSWEIFDQLTVLFELCVPLAFLRPIRRWIFLFVPLFHLATILLLGIDFSRLLLVYIPLALLFCVRPTSIHPVIPLRVRVIVVTACLLGLAFCVAQAWLFEKPPRSLLSLETPGLFLFPLLECIIIVGLLAHLGNPLRKLPTDPEQ